MVNMNEKNKVLITLPQLTITGGVTNYYKVLSPYLSYGIDYFIACKRDRESKLETARRLWRDYRNFKNKLPYYDLIHLNPSLGPKAIIRDGLFLKAAKRQGKKVIVFMRGWDKAFEAKIRKRWLWMVRKYYFKADTFIVLAKEFKQSLIEMGYQDKIFVETTAIDDSVFSYLESHCGSVSEHDKFNILFLTRIEKYKGIYEAIESFAELKKTHTNVKFTIAGNGSEFANVKKYISNKGLVDIKLKGFVSGAEKWDTYIDADCYLFPSYSEGMPNSVLEAMAFGLPIITRPVGGLKDFFESGKMGFITESLEPVIFADLIGKLIENPQLRMQIAKYNHNYAKNRFMASKVANRLEDIYRQVFIDSPER